MNETSTTYQELSSTSPKKPLYSNWKTCGIGWRAVALTFDGFIISLLWLFGILGVLLCLDKAIFIALLESIMNEGNREAAADSLNSVKNIATLVMTLISVLVVLGYGTLSESSILAGTPGKYIMGLRVVTSDKGGIDLSDALARNIYKHLLTIVGGALTAITIFFTSQEDVPALFLITGASLIITIGLLIYSIADPLVALFSSKHQTLHDSWAGTLVVKAPGVNRWLRMLLGLFLFFAISILGSAACALLFATRFQQFAEDLKIFDELEKKFEVSPLDTPLPMDFAPLGDDSTSLRISKELALQRKMLESDSQKKITPPSPSKDSTTVRSTPTPWPSKKDFTPQEDGFRVLSKKLSGANASRPQSYSPSLTKGRVSIHGQTFQVKEAVAAMAPNTQVIVLNLYDTPLEPTLLRTLSTNVRALITHDQPLVRFKILLNKQGSGCSEDEVIRYTVDFNSLKAKMPLQKKFFSFERSANEISSTEYVQFDCERRESGYIRAEVRGSHGILLNGSRIPVQWDIEVTVPLNSPQRVAAIGK